MFVFFCKQKTAYEMRISDWSSDVCSSDLFSALSAGLRQAVCNLNFAPAMLQPDETVHPREALENKSDECADPDSRRFRITGSRHHHQCLATRRPHRHARGRWRSEEHTSELQSLMRISYAVFCLKKNK